MQDGITSDRASDRASDTAGDVTWMSYVELGRARGISASSAKRLAIRRHWRRQQGNDGTARVAVPVTEAVPRESKPGDDTGDVTGLPSLAAGALAALEDAVSGLREQLDVANARAERAEADRSDERQRADDLRERLIAMQEQLADAHAALQAAEEAKARAGRAEQSRDEERARADRSDAALTAERTRADTLRDRLDEVQRDVKASEAIASELRGDLDAARAQGQATQEVADAQARLMAARRSRGLLARLRAAVRGE